MAVRMKDDDVCDMYWMFSIFSANELHIYVPCPITYFPGWFTQHDFWSLTINKLDIKVL